jgi:putative DNA primase/helicase
LTTKAVPHDYLPGAKGEKFKGFLDRVLPDPDVQSFVQRLLGSALSAEPRERVFPVFQGRGANGKSTLMDIVGEVVKPYVKKTAASTFLAKDTDSTVRSDLAGLQGARLVIAGETPSRRKLDSVTIKSLTGDREFTARPLYREEVTFAVTFIAVMVSNPLPHVDEADSALWDRLVLVPFDVHIPKSERVKDLVEVIVREEAEAVLAWLVEGALASQSGPDVPDACVRRTAAWRRAVGTIEKFKDEDCEVIVNHRASLSELHQRYQYWARCRQFHPAGIESFRHRLNELGVQVVDCDEGEIVVGLKPGRVRKPTV